MTRPVRWFALPLALVVVGCAEEPATAEVAPVEERGWLVVQVLTDELLPVVDADVVVEPAAWRNRTGDDGRTARLWVAPGEYDVAAHAHGFMANRTRVEVHANETVKATLVLRQPAAPEPAWSDRDAAGLCHMGRRDDGGSLECWNPLPWTPQPRVAWTVNRNATDLLMVWFEWQASSSATEKLAFRLVLKGASCEAEAFDRTLDGASPVGFRLDAEGLTALGLETCLSRVEATVSPLGIDGDVVVMDQPFEAFLLARHPGQG